MSNVNNLGQLPVLTGLSRRPPAGDWGKPDVLWRMNKDSKFLDDVAGQLLQVAKISEPIIAGLVRKYKK